MFLDLDRQTRQLIIDQDAERLAAKDAVAQASSDDHYSPAKVAFVEFCVRQCVANSDLVASRMGIKYKCLATQRLLSKQEADIALEYLAKSFGYYGGSMTTDPFTQAPFGGNGTAP